MCMCWVLYQHFMQSNQRYRDFSLNQFGFPSLLLLLHNHYKGYGTLCALFSQSYYFIVVIPCAFCVWDFKIAPFCTVQYCTIPLWSQNNYLRCQQYLWRTGTVQQCAFSPNIYLTTILFCLFSCCCVSVMEVLSSLFLSLFCQQTMFCVCFSCV